MDRYLPRGPGPRSLGGPGLGGGVALLPLGVACNSKQCSGTDLGKGSLSGKLFVGDPGRGFCRLIRTWPSGTGGSGTSGSRGGANTRGVADVVVVLKPPRTNLVRGGSPWAGESTSCPGPGGRGEAHGRPCGSSPPPRAVGLALAQPLIAPRTLPPMDSSAHGRVTPLRWGGEGLRGITGWTQAAFPGWVGPPPPWGSLPQIQAAPGGRPFGSSQGLPSLPGCRLGDPGGRTRNFYLAS